MPYLVLSRQEGERIHVGDDIILEVVEIRNNRVRLAVIAPRDTKVLRAELLDRPATTGGPAT